MAELFRKGQMIPKRLKMALTHRRAQHCITFGCDVLVEGRFIRAVDPSSGPIMNIPAFISRKRTNGTRQKHPVLVENVRFENCTKALTSGEWSMYA